MRQLGIALLVVFALAACAPVDDEGQKTKDERRTTKDAGRTTIVATTVTPTSTLTATPLPTATATPTATPTPTRTLTPAESRAARLPALANWRWQAKGNDIILADAQSNTLATLDEKTGGLRWYSEKYFHELDVFLNPQASPQDRAALVSWMKALEEQGVHFITFPDTRENFPSYVLVLSPDGNEVKMIAAKKGTADFVYHADAKKVMGVFPDGSGYFYVNLDGSFDIAPLQAQAKEIAQSLRDRGVIQHPDPAKADFIQKAVEKAIEINPYGVTPEEINKFIKARTSRDFAQHFNEKWGNKVGVTYEQVMAATLAQSPKDVFGHVTYIGNTKNPLCKNTCWLDNGYSGEIHIAEGDIRSDAYYPLQISLIKESSGSKAYMKAFNQASNKKPFYEDEELGARIGGAISFAIQAYTLNQYPEISPYSSEQITRSISRAFEGGIVVQ